MNSITKKNKDSEALKDIAYVFNKLISDKKNNKGKTAIKVKNLSFSIKHRLLLNNINFEVKCGEMHGLVGPNGAGKTTIIKNIIDAYTTRNKESEIKIMGFEAGSIAAKRSVAYIPEYAAFPEHLTLLEYLVTMAKFSNIESKEAKEKALELIDLLGLKPHININPNNFSSGMKKKVLLAQSLMCDPEVLILDEPAANLDPLARNMLFQSLKNLTKTGLSIFISSHILAELEGLITSITLINNGNVSYSGPVKEISDEIQKDKLSQIRIYANIVNHSQILEIGKILGLEIKEEAQSIIFSTPDKNLLYEVLELIGSRKVEVERIEFDNITLQDIYESEFK